MKDSPNKNTQVQRIVALVLTALFIPVIFSFGVYSVVDAPYGAYDSLRFHRAEKFLADPDDYSFLDLFVARLKSLEAQLGSNIMFSDQLGYINASFQYALGKDMVMQGSEQLLKLDGGQIYNMTSRETLEPHAREVVGLYEQLDGRVPFLFAYINPQFYEGSIELPAGYDVLDKGEELADQVLGIIRDAGIETLDSRDFFADCGYTDDELNLSTDMHWTTLAALVATETFAEEINRLAGSNLDISKIRIDQFETETYPDIFLGEYGQQVGEINSGLDDITLFWPKYETSFSRMSMKRNRKVSNAEGSFKDAIIKWEALESPTKGANISAYRAYGLIEHIEELTNHGDCEDMTILLFRDSYTAPVGCFLSLMAKNVIMVDMRTADMTAIEYVEKYDPDMVIMAHSRQMFEDHAYDLGTGFEQFAAEAGM